MHSYWRRHDIQASRVACLCAELKAEETYICQKGTGVGSQYTTCHTLAEYQGMTWYTTWRPKMDCDTWMENLDNIKPRRGEYSSVTMFPIPNRRVFCR